ncbi:MAG: hypothetical protein DRQ49_01575 [Gammaproteobacteria bacterium]|nr:MAG: hypothetical protein DRQ49_01575 [Gammaproteobacteria bacterium]RKZ45423.1 MAG: hypothetical protein DRQ41_00205 [Gammaproteobacteria bacterium]RKZ75105.1 MAG: hypothetical protein DRQ57_08745 [Gammaproteobacteria bacterium]
MSLSHTGLILALGLSFNTAIANENSDRTIPIYTQGEQPLLLAEKYSNRRRGDCGTSPDIWALNICETSKFCYVQPENVSLWLSEDKRAEWVDWVFIKDSVSHKEVELRWSASKQTLAWPWQIKRMPIQSGKLYLIKRKGDMTYNEVILYQIPANLSKEEQKDWMREKGCIPQVNILDQEQRV